SSSARVVNRKAIEARKRPAKSNSGTDAGTSKRDVAAIEERIKTVEERLKPSAERLKATVAQKSKSSVTAPRQNERIIWIYFQRRF
ncbi:hypothetical protein, partial [Mesorhizobium sp.]|uniref:hypothetical protein n=1 Tax=Mesorhizobium sp. TaxID=1871066 RepID=UPI0025F4A74B